MPRSEWPNGVAGQNITADSRSSHDKAYLPAEQSAQAQDPRVSSADEDPVRTGDPERSSPQGSRKALRLTGGPVCWPHETAFRAKKVLGALLGLAPEPGAGPL